MPSEVFLIDANTPEVAGPVSAIGDDWAQFTIESTTAELTTAIFQMQSSAGSLSQWTNLGPPLAQAGASEYLSIDGVAWVRVIASTPEGSTVLARVTIFTERK